MQQFKRSILLLVFGDLQLVSVQSVVPHVNQAESFSTHLAFKTLTFLTKYTVNTLQRVLQQSAMLSLVIQLVGSAGFSLSGVTLNGVLTSAA